jgi:hypothetical protein
MTVSRMSEEVTPDELAEWVEFFAMRNEAHKKNQDKAKAESAARGAGKRRR